ncbi:MAG: fused MFS/spermidine synthase [Chloroflexi bacterium]|nr:fused MFS/spermidine synthase [Chloroflexota bacterium]
MRKTLTIAVFFSGMASLGIEMAASRLLGNVFGTSNLVWASIIGLILIYLAVGYFIGGRWADRSPHPETFFKILTWAGISTAVVPVLSRPVLRLAANAFDELQLGILLGSFTSVLILLVIPMILLGTASPFAIRLAVQDSANIGQTSGQIYAISTLGSFIGTFLPVLLLIPTLGTYRTFLFFSAILLVVGLTGLYLHAGARKILPFLWAPLLIIFLWVWGLPGGAKNTPGMVYETESAYNYIQVLEYDSYHYLRLNEGQGVHSVYHPTELNYYGPWEQVLVAPFFNPAPVNTDDIRSLAIVGLAAGTTARQASIVYPHIQIDGIEIDPKIVEVGREYFDMNQPNLNVIVQDGRWALAHSDQQYQIISIDAYRPPYIPAHLTSQEFFTTVREHLTADGVMVINVGRGPNDRRLIDALSTTILTVFPTIHIVDIPGSFNSILFATVQPTAPENLAANYLNLVQQETANPLLLRSIEVAAAQLQPQPQVSLVFTDDKAPIEWMTNNMVIQFLLSGNKEMLQ